MRELTIGKRRACLVGIIHLIDHVETAQFVLSPLLKLRGAVTPESIRNHLEIPNVRTTDSLEHLVEENMVVLLCQSPLAFRSRDGGFSFVIPAIGYRANTFAKPKAVTAAIPPTSNVWIALLNHSFRARSGSPEQFS